jgi:hypothetical protein
VPRHEAAFSYDCFARESKLSLHAGYIQRRPTENISRNKSRYLGKMTTHIRRLGLYKNADPERPFQEFSAGNIQNYHPKCHFFRIRIAPGRGSRSWRKPQDQVIALWSRASNLAERNKRDLFSSWSDTASGSDTTSGSDSVKTGAPSSVAATAPGCHDSEIMLAFFQEIVILTSKTPYPHTLHGRIILSALQPR